MSMLMHDNRCLHVTFNIFLPITATLPCYFTLSRILVSWLLMLSSFFLQWIESPCCNRMLYCHRLQCIKYIYILNDGLGSRLYSCWKHNSTRSTWPIKRTFLRYVVHFYFFFNVVVVVVVFHGRIFFFTFSMRYACLQPHNIRDAKSYKTVTDFTRIKL